MMMTGIVPFKTQEGHDELARRTRRLGQRHRTLLLLVDGRRSVDQVLALARAAGVDEEHYRALVEMGLIAVPDGALTAPTQAMPLDDEPDDAGAAEPEFERSSELDVELPLAGDARIPTPSVPAAPAAARATLVAPAPMAEPQAPAALAVTRRPSAHAAEPPPELTERAPEPDRTPAATGFDAPDWLPAPVDGPLEQAREVLVRALRAEAPIAGQLTLMKVRHANDRAELEALLREVEERIARPRQRLAAARTMRHVRNLLRTPPDTAFTMY